MNNVNLARLGTPTGALPPSRSAAQPFGVVPAMRSHPRENLRCVEAEMLGYEDPRVAALTRRPKQFAARRGLRYEKQVLAALASRLPDIFHGPWLSYRLAGEATPHVCQPDGLWHEPGHALVVEVKATHSSEAWKQLELYSALARCMWPGEQVQTLNVVKSFDPRVPFPVEQELFDDIDAVLADHSLGYRVLVWKK